MFQHGDTRSTPVQSENGLLEQLSRHVVVGLAGTSAPLGPVLLALDLVEAGKGFLDVLMVVEDPATAVLPFGRSLAIASWAWGEKDLRRKRMNELIRKVTKAISEREVVATACQARGSLAGRMEAAAYSASLLVLHRLGPDLGGTDLMVTAARRLLRRCRLPLLAAPLTYNTPSRVVVALGDEQMADPQLLSTGAALATGLALPLTVYSVGDEVTRAQIKHAARRELQTLGMEASFRGRRGQRAELIADQADPNVLLLMGTGNGGLKERAKGSITEKVLRHARGPLLLVRRIPR